MRIKVNRYYAKAIGKEYGTLEVSLPNELIQRLEAFLSSEYDSPSTSDTKRGVFVHGALESYLDRREAGRRAEAYLCGELEAATP
jgi:metal-responsive CopG/Arc/MetJ family transcriptional regulator